MCSTGYFVNSARPTVYSSSNSNAYRPPDESYHDYMNTDSFSAPHNNSLAPVGTGPAPANQQPGLVTGTTTPPSGHTGEDQRLLSVSGKKKCSHCGEELGNRSVLSNAFS